MSLKKYFEELKEIWSASDEDILDLISNDDIEEYAESNLDMIKRKDCDSVQDMDDDEITREYLSRFGCGEVSLLDELLEEELMQLKTKYGSLKLLELIKEL